MVQSKSFLPSQDEELNNFLAQYGNKITDNGICTFPERTVIYYNDSEPGDKSIQIRTLDSILESLVLQRIGAEQDKRVALSKEILKSGGSEQQDLNINNRMNAENKIKEIDLQLRTVRDLKKDVEKGDLVI